MKTVNTGYMVRAPTWGAWRQEAADPTTEYRREAATSDAGTQPPKDRAAFFIPKINNQKFFRAAQRQKVRKIYGIF